MATGLKICFLFNAKIYFDAIAMLETEIKKNNSGVVLKGATIKDKIIAEM